MKATAPLILTAIKLLLLSPPLLVRPLLRTSKWMTPLPLSCMTARVVPRS